MTTPDYGPTRAQVARMRAKIADGIVVRERRARVRRRVTFAVSGVVAASLITGGVVVATLPPASDFSCYVADDLSSINHRISYPMDLEPPTDIPTQVRWALELCEMSFELQKVAPSENPVVCRTPDLKLGVLPNRDDLTSAELCSSLGLLLPEDPVPGYESG